MNSTHLSKKILEKELEEIEFLIKGFHNPDMYSILYDKFYYLIDKIPFAMYLKKPGNIVYRCRQNINNEIFKCYKQVSYPPKEYVKKYGRANLLHESTFYGCIPSQLKEDEKAIDAYNACVLEADKELLTDIEGVFRKIYTVGKWNTIESQSHFVYLPFSHKAFLNNAMIRDVMQMFLVSVNGIYPREEVEQIIIPFQKFVALRFSAKKVNINDYILTNAFKNALINYYKAIGAAINGIIYSSPMTDCAAINVALTQEYADNFLKLDKIIMMSCDGLEKRRNFDGLTDVINVTDKGEFEVVFIKN
jgi:hypothetical protein